MNREHESDPVTEPRRKRQEFSRAIRSRLRSHLYDDSGCAPGVTALYCLSDPREIREIRYVGITDDPARRLLQHWNAARLWLPDQTPWWIESPKLRPLYTWIRNLHRDGDRLPVMLVTAWLGNSRDARLAERKLIYECLGRDLPLFNFEREVLDRQIPLL